MECNCAFLTQTRIGLQRALEQFRDDDGITVMLLVKAAGSLGLNLQFAAHLILFDPHWNNALDEQVRRQRNTI